MRRLVGRSFRRGGVSESPRTPRDVAATPEARDLTSEFSQHLVLRSVACGHDSLFGASGQAGTRLQLYMLRSLLWHTLEPREEHACVVSQGALAEAVKRVELAVARWNLSAESSRNLFNMVMRDSLIAPAARFMAASIISRGNHAELVRAFEQSESESQEVADDCVALGSAHYDAYTSSLTLPDSQTIPLSSALAPMHNTDVDMWTWRTPTSAEPVHLLYSPEARMLVMVRNGEVLCSAPLERAATVIQRLFL